MIKTLVFVTVDSGRLIGEVRLQDGKLVADEPLQDLVDAHLESGDPPNEFMLAYDGWSNGYVSAGEVTKLRPVKERDDPPELDRPPTRRSVVKVLPTAERDAALRDHYETTQVWDEENGEMWDPKTPPPYPDASPEDEDG